MAHRRRAPVEHRTGCRGSSTEISRFPRPKTRLDLNVVAESLDWERNREDLRAHGRTPAGESRPVRGRSGLRAEHFIIDRVPQHPVLCRCRDHTPGRPACSSNGAGFCGITLIGRISFDGPMVDAHLVPVLAEGMALDSVVSCLTAEKSKITRQLQSGTGHFRSNARREGPRQGLGGAVHGRFRGRQHSAVDFFRTAPLLC